jgi:DnaJ-class molecular chaperone
MSLYDSGFHGPPEIGAYEQQERIPTEDRCPSCKGLGTIRWQNSMTGKDWKTCWVCEGRGRSRGKK